MILAKKKQRNRGPSWPWSYGVYHHWCEFESRSERGVQHYVIKFVSDLRQVGGFFSGSSGFLHQQHWPPRYNWNIVESGILHHQTNKQNHAIFPETVQYYFKSWRHRQDKMVLGSIFSQVLLYNNRIIAQISMNIILYDYIITICLC